MDTRLRHEVMPEAQTGRGVMVAGDAHDLQAARGGAAAFVSSHHLDEVARIADRVSVIDWSNAARGMPEADHARTLLLLRWADPLPGTPVVTRWLMALARAALGYAGAQKNLGPVGVTVVILRRDLLERGDVVATTRSWAGGDTAPGLALWKRLAARLLDDGGDQRVLLATGHKHAFQSLMGLDDHLAAAHTGPPARCERPDSPAPAGA